jgi:peptidoglycan/LPS O-acetylase OafA/YrhL
MFMIMVGLAAFPAQYSFLAVAQTLLFQSDYMALNAGPYTTMFWAIGVELQFYLLFPVLHHFIEHEGKRWAVAGIALCVIMRLVAVNTGGVGARDVSYWHLLGRLDQFLIGMLSARLYRHYEARALPWGMLSIAGSAIMFGVIMLFNQAGGWPTTPLWKVGWPTVEALAWAGVLVPYARFAQQIPGLISKPLALIGSMSYSIYLLHYTCIQMMPRYVNFKFSDDPNVASQLYVALVVLPVVLALAALTYYTVERPFLRLRVRYVRESGVVASEAIAKSAIRPADASIQANGT